MIEELCIAGGQHKGIAYIGVLKRIEHLLQLKKLVGNSIGAFIGCLIIIGYTSDELLDIVLDVNLNTFTDININNEELSLVKGEEFRNWVKLTIEKKINPFISLKDLYEKTKIHFIISQVSLKRGPFYMDYENSPDISLYDAMIATMSIPFLFPPHKINDEHFVDGGIIDNFPIHLLSEQGLGIKIKGRNKNYLDDNGKISGSAYIARLLGIVFDTISSSKVIKTNNIIEVNIPNSLFVDFNIDNDDKLTLFKNGYDSISEDFLQKLKRI